MLVDLLGRHSSGLNHSFKLSSEFVHVGRAKFSRIMALKDRCSCKIGPISAIDPFHEGLKTNRDNIRLLILQRLVLLGHSSLEAAEVSHSGLLSTGSELLSPSGLVPLVLDLT